MEVTTRGEIIFAVTVEDVQQEAVSRIGRRLDEDEMFYAKKAIEAGLSFDIDTVFTAAIKESVKVAEEYVNRNRNTDGQEE